MHTRKRRRRTFTRTPRAEEPVISSCSNFCHRSDMAAQARPPPVWAANCALRARANVQSPNEQNENACADILSVVRPMLFSRKSARARHCIALLYVSIACVLG